MCSILFTHPGSITHKETFWQLKNVNRMLCRHKNSLLFLQYLQSLETQKLQEFQLSYPTLSTPKTNKQKKNPKCAFLEAAGYSCSGHGDSSEQDEDWSIMRWDKHCRSIIVASSLGHWVAALDPTQALGMEADKFIKIIPLSFDLLNREKGTYRPLLRCFC